MKVSKRSQTRKELGLIDPEDYRNAEDGRETGIEFGQTQFETIEGLYFMVKVDGPDLMLVFPFRHQTEAVEVAWRLIREKA